MKIALLFPGSGSHYQGMGKALYDHYSIAREAFDEASESMNISYSQICMEDNLEQLNQLPIAQTAIFVCSVAAFRVYNEQMRLPPLFAAGHSLGEYAALVSAGALTFSEAIHLVHYRSQLMEEAAKTAESMVIAVSNMRIDPIKAELKKIDQSEQIIDVACLNMLEQTVISGHKPLVEQLIPKLEAMGARVTRLQINVPVHSRIMRTVAERFRERLSETTFLPTRWPVVSNVSALPYENKSAIIEQLTLQLISPVRWLDTQLFMQRNGVSHTLELGPKSTLTAFTRKNTRNIQAFSLENDPNLETIQKWKRSGGNIYERCLALAVSTENSCSNLEEYQKGCVEPYQQLIELKKLSELMGTEPSVEHKNKALDLLSRILTTKQMDFSLQRQKVKKLLESVGEASFIKQFN